MAPAISIWTAQIGLGGLYILKGKGRREEAVGWRMALGGVRGEYVKIH